MRPWTNKVLVRIALGLLGILYLNTVTGQTSEESATTFVSANYHYPYSVEGGGELTYPLSNFAYKDNFGGVYSLHASFQRQLVGGLYVGLEIQDNQTSEVTPITFRVAVATTNIFFYNAGLKISYYSSQAGNWLFCGSVTAGESFVEFTKVPVAPPPGGYGKQAFFFTPRICESYRVNEELFIGLEVSYSMYGYVFDPNYVGVTKSYSGNQVGGNTSFLNWGFGIHYFIGKPKNG